MVLRTVIAFLSMIAATTSATAAQHSQRPHFGAPTAAPDARYCLRVEAVTGTRLETVQCWTRDEWAEMEVDVDEEWAEEGVRIIGPRRT